MVLGFLMNVGVVGVASTLRRTAAPAELALMTNSPMSALKLLSYGIP
jgi:hypothetical protein